MPNGGLAISSAHLPSSSGGGFEFPVGHILIDSTGTDPATYLGYGTWAKVGAGRVLIGQDTGDGDFDTLLETGGAKTVAAAGAVAAPTISGSTDDESSHTHDVPTVPAHTHTITDPGHTHALSIQGGGTVNIAGTHVTASVSAGGSARDANADSFAKSNTTGITVDSAGSASPATSAGSAHNHGAGTLAASAPGFTGSATSVVQPYLVVCFWKRTA